MKNTEANVLNSGKYIDPEFKFYVYVHKRKDNDDVFYVGKGSSNRLLMKRKYNPYWQRIADKYGFYPEIVSNNLKEKEAFDLEIKLIKFYGRENLSNLTNGGEGTSGFSMPDEAKNKISKALSGVPKKKRTKEHTENHANSIRGVPLSEDHKMKISKSSKGKGVRSVASSNGMVFESVIKASEWVKINCGSKSSCHQNISACARGKIKSAYGFKWSYI